MTESELKITKMHDFSQLFAGFWQKTHKKAKFHGFLWWVLSAKTTKAL
jgi:hypothetical protein